MTLETCRGTQLYVIYIKLCIKLVLIKELYYDARPTESQDLHKVRSTRTAEDILKNGPKHVGANFKCLNVSLVPFKVYVIEVHELEY
jgi:hypothetical protein